MRNTAELHLDFHMDKLLKKARFCNYMNFGKRHTLMNTSIKFQFPFTLSYWFPITAL